MGNLSPTPPTSSASTGSLGGSGSGAPLASTADSFAHGGSVSGENANALPPRRRLGKLAVRAAQTETKREGLGGPPGFGIAASPSPTLSSPAAPNLPSGTGIGGMGTPGVFRERVSLRSSGKDLAGDPHGIGGPSKLGRSPHMNSTGSLEARHLGRRPEVNMRRHEPPGQSQKYAAEQQAKRAAVQRQQTSGSVGNFKQFDSSHNNYLVPVIPIQFAAKQSLP